MNDIDKIVFGNNEKYFDEIYPNIWIIHNHKWSLHCWEQYRKNNKFPSTLVNLNFHWNACNDYNENESTIRDTNLKNMKNSLIKDSNIRKDSFIAPSIIRGYINKVDFHCFQKDTVGLDESFVNKYKVVQNIYDSIKDLVHNIGEQEIILDLDLDMFNTLGSKLGKLWDKEKVESYLRTITPLIKQAKIIAIAIPYGHTGNDEDIECITKFVVPMIIDIKNI